MTGAEERPGPDGAGSASASRRRERARDRLRQRLRCTPPRTSPTGVDVRSAVLRRSVLRLRVRPAQWPELRPARWLPRRIKERRRARRRPRRRRRAADELIAREQQLAARAPAVEVGGCAALADPQRRAAAQREEVVGVVVAGRVRAQRRPALGDQHRLDAGGRDAGQRRGDGARLVARRAADLDEDRAAGLLARRVRDAPARSRSRGGERDGDGEQDGGDRAVHGARCWQSLRVRQRRLGFTP